MFYDLGVRFGEPERAVAMAKRLGYSGLCILHPYMGKEDLRDFFGRARAAGKAVGIDIVSGAEVLGNLKSVRRSAERIRDNVEIVCVNGDYEAKRWASSSPMVDLICLQAEGKESMIDHIIAREASANGVGFELSLSAIRRVRGKTASRAIHNLTECARLAQWAVAKVVVTSGAQNEWEMAGPSELASFGDVMGLGYGKRTVSEFPRSLLIENRETLAGKKVAKGVRVL